MAKPHVWITTREQTPEQRRRPPVGHERGGTLPGMLFAASCGITWR
jgi:hypothetical protein